MNEAARYHVLALVCAGPHEAIVGSHQTTEMSKDECLAAIEDMSKIPLDGSSWGEGARAVAAYGRMRRPGGMDVTIARSSWIDQLDWSPQPKNGQPRR